MNDLPVEKQLTHKVFCNQIKNIDLPKAKQMLVELHLLYLGQQALMVKTAKNEFRGLQ